MLYMEFWGGDHNYREYQKRRESKGMAKDDQYSINGSQKIVGGHHVRI